MKKLVIEKCNECPWRIDKGSGVWLCGNVGKEIPPEVATIPTWCPLPDEME